MSNKTLRTLYARMVEGRKGRAEGTGSREDRAAWFDVACWVSAGVCLTKADVVFGCRNDGVLAVACGSLPSRADGAIAGGVNRLYAAAGAALALRGTAGRVVAAFFERHETGAKGWAEALRFGAELPLILLVLPRWKSRADELDLGREARTAGVPGIAVDAADAVALYRVAQESVGRARAGGGAALIEAVRLPGEVWDVVDPVAGLGGYLQRRAVATEAWMRRVEKRSGGVSGGII